MKNKFNQIFVLTIIVFSVLGCSYLRQIPELVSKQQEPQNVVSTDGKVRLTVPGYWRIEKGLNDQAVLQVSYRLQELYAIVIPDEKTELPKGTNLDSFTDLVRSNMKQSVPNAVLLETTSTTVNGFEAQRFEMRGKIDKIKGFFIFTLIDTPDTYYQIMSWTMDSMSDKNKPKLLEVSDSFQLVGNSTPDQIGNNKK